jgi:hypothetical protein
MYDRRRESPSGWGYSGTLWKAGLAESDLRKRIAGTNRKTSILYAYCAYLGIGINETNAGYAIVTL